MTPLLDLEVNVNSKIRDVVGNILPYEQNVRTQLYRALSTGLKIRLSLQLIGDVQTRI